MTPFLLYHPKTRPTGRALAKLLGIRFGAKCEGRKNENISHIIRWGNIREVDATWADIGEFEWPRGTEPAYGSLVWKDRKVVGRWRHRTEINTRQAITLAGSKFRALQALQTAGVLVPTFWRVRDDEEPPWPESKISLGRKYRHSRGTDIRIFHGLGNEPFYKSDYITAYIKPHKEYRVHVMGGQVLFAQRKYFRNELFEKLTERFDLDSQLDKFTEESQIIRNNDHGWGFHDMNSLENIPKAVLDASISAVDALGLDFGAVDVITDAQKENGSRRAFVLEINTAPGLRDRNLEKYADGLSNLLKSK